jgi:hypothetical protein
MNNIDLLNLTPSLGFKILGAATNDYAGYSVSNAGDINGDGISDVIVGASRADPSGRNYAGTAYVIYGKSGGLTDVDLLSLTATQGFKILGAANDDYAGHSVSSAGDINGDGIKDVIIGSYCASSSGGRSLAGTAAVIYGKSGGLTDVDLLSLTAAQGFKILGAVASYYTGNSVSSAGDINGDGISDVMVGAERAHPSGRSHAGIAYVIYGKSGGRTDVDLLSLTAAQGFKILGAAASDFTGNSVSSVGDINGDGISDVMVGAEYADPSGREDAGISYVIYGKSGDRTDVDLLSLSAAQGFKILGANAYDFTGNSVSSAGDINGDGFNDIIVGANGASPSGRGKAGAAYGIYGKPGGLTDVDLLSLTAAQGFKILGAAVGDQVGVSVSAGDINGDGSNDILVGTFYADSSGRTDAGAAYGIYGVPLPTTNPTEQPTLAPTAVPSLSPTISPTAQPTIIPSVSTTASPTEQPTTAPSPTLEPTAMFSVAPTISPSLNLTASPTEWATSIVPTIAPTVSPTTNQTEPPVAIQPNWTLAEIAARAVPPIVVATIIGLVYRCYCKKKQMDSLHLNNNHLVKELSVVEMTDHTALDIEPTRVDNTPHETHVHLDHADDGGWLPGHHEQIDPAI